ncbi:MAG: DNA/RNA-binding protein AlbA [Nitrososphaerota archaeon]|nr:DNA/RNA-binding protein AlbA [Candidatus Calditenuaceae archaeon]MDW8073372.1 DNA/RNA-binding protein AlbA [Nitrososphaerota archaeon]
MIPQIIIGKKPVLRYVTACITTFNRGSNRVTLRARGRRISSCVDVVNALRRGFLTDIQIESINIGTETITINSKERKISYIEITLRR